MYVQPSPPRHIIARLFVMGGTSATSSFSHQASRWGHPRFHAEYFIRKSLKEIEAYASVFQHRVARAFDDLEDEAHRIQEEAYSSCDAGPDDDPSRAAEWAYFQGVDYYLATDAVRQGVFNLMAAGLFHLFEQQTLSLVARELPKPKTLPKAKNTLDRFARVVKPLGVDIKAFKSYPLLDELRLVANTVKHGDGSSAKELQARNPKLFQDDHGHTHLQPLRPLIGQGLTLTEDHFKAYKACLEQFWSELTSALLPIFCPQVKAATSKSN